MTLAQFDRQFNRRWHLELREVAFGRMAMGHQRWVRLAQQGMKKRLYPAFEWRPRVLH